MKTLRGKRDGALLALLLACGLRRHEAVSLDSSDVQWREAHSAIVDLRGKAGHVRTVPMPDWAKGIIDQWLCAAGIKSGRVFRRVNKAGRIWGESMTEKIVWHVVREFASQSDIDKLAPHDLRRTCARLCHSARSRTGADPVVAGTCLNSDDRAISRLQSAFGL